MEEIEAMDTCPNCNREIPTANFMVHTAHCARNIKICTVCKEPMPANELDEHHDKLHMLLPCKKCSELVRGTDMEDHIRDSCAFTMQSCRFCTLELRRREVPQHERYCGARTERCADCGEYVMLRYRQLHVESNHGFLRLDDDSPPRLTRRELLDYPPHWPIARAKEVTRNTNIPGKLNEGPLGAWCRRQRELQNEDDYDPVLSAELIRDQIMGTFAYRPPQDEQPSASTADGNAAASRPINIRPPPKANGLPKFPKRTNDQPQVNTNVEPQDKVQKNLTVARGAVKKRPAPAPPAAATTSATSPATSSATSSTTAPATTSNKSPTISFATSPTTAPATTSTKTPGTSSAKSPATSSATSSVPPPSAVRDMPYYSAMQRLQDEERRRMEENAYNRANGLPPVLSPAAKVEKLRKMDALHNRELADNSHKSRLQGRVWQNNNDLAPAGHTLGRSTPTQNTANGESSSTVPQDADVESERNKLRDLKPMSQEQFMERFSALQLRPAAARAANGTAAATDRYGEIRTSLRELRRGLNEVTAPYTNNNHLGIDSNILNQLEESAFGIIDVPDNNRLDEARAPSPPRPTGLIRGGGLIVGPRTFRPDRAALRGGTMPPRAEPDLLILCEYCNEPQRARLLSCHEEWCRVLADRRARPTSPWDDESPVLPCEFCAEALPYYLLTEHQELCSQDAHLM